MLGRTNAGSPSGIALDLTIVGSTTRPAKPTQNMIWINTDVEITSYVLSATEPKNPVEGMVWITIGNSGSIKMTSPVRDEWITVYPLFASQYIGGAWADKTAISYQFGEWVDWIQWLYKDGNQYISITGGWKAEVQSGMTISFSDDIEITWLGGTYVGACFYTKKPIDLTDKSWVKATGLITNRYGSDFPITLMVCKTIPINWQFTPDSSANLTVSNVESPIEVDVRALSGAYYIVCNPGGTTGRVSDIQYE